MPCTVPSSPIGPCSNGSTTVTSSSPAAPASLAMTSATDTDGPVVSSRSGSAPGPAARAAWAASPSAHSPLVEMPIGVTRYLRRVDRRQHVGRRHAADVVLGRLAAVEHDEVDAAHDGQRYCHAVRCARGRLRYRSASEVPRVRRRRGDRRTLVGDDVELDGASFDTRTLRPGELFVPLVAERDGHDFIAAAAAAGAAATLTSQGAGSAL